jgi:hypothetical protein
MGPGPGGNWGIITILWIFLQTWQLRFSIGLPLDRHSPIRCLHLNQVTRLRSFWPACYFNQSLGHHTGLKICSININKNKVLCIGRWSHCLALEKSGASHAVPQASRMCRREAIEAMHITVVPHASTTYKYPFLSCSIFSSWISSLFL